MDYPSHDQYAVFFVAASLLILVTMFGISSYLDSSRATNAIQAEFHGIYITGYYAEGKPVLVKPNLTFGKYSMHMSSMSGFPLQIECVDADRIHLQVNKGSFISWSPLTSKVIQKGKAVDIKSGNKIYYAPDFKFTTGSAKIEITAFKKNKELGRNTIEITSKDGIFYTGMLLAR